MLKYFLDWNNGMSGAVSPGQANYFVTAAAARTEINLHQHSGETSVYTLISQLVESLSHLKLS